MKPFLVNYREQTAVIVAGTKIEARDCYQEKFLKEVDGVDKRKIKTAELSGLEWSGPALSKPKVLKTVVMIEG